MRVELKETTWEFRAIFDAHTDDEAQFCLEAWCEATVRSNMVWINAVVHRTGHYPPCCLESAGVTYLLPQACPGVDAPCQTIRGAQEILDSGEGTCIDIASYMAAQLRLRGQGAIVFLRNMMIDGRPMPAEYHVLLRTDNGVVDYTEDLIAGRTQPCALDCGSITFDPVDPSTFDPARVLAR